MDSDTRWIDIQGDDGTFQAYQALPRGGKGPGIVLIQEIFGVNAHIRSVAEQYAADGYVVLAPDLFWRQGAHIELAYDEADWKKAVALKGATDTQKAVADVAATIRALRGLDGVQNVASIGYCFGGLLSYLAAAAGNVDAAVAYYGGGIQNQLDKADDVTVPLLMHFGGKDSHIPNDAVKSIAERFGDRDNVEIHVYPDAEHGFNCSHRGSYHQRSAVEAHGHTLLFLAENQ
ncbi:dienelactone hydrolase family protein [Pseudoduganella umbonata]|uniref:Carboxymethylenebutenolidase n=1 Tax=Pseudoduganella umbonata TaxID=864828 RepID=A0A4P8HWU9_9BURK|nr:dienelactone hydrolase family protein [Pseudoduganella umbonata]MBB3223011.1 carboxymethylenebutenolidase [Pseudoduganella umbonata]QCP13120.1 dienelactone hydrolase family protein [Pseudoduganella umbonata]